jgi:plastocyanin
MASGVAARAALAAGLLLPIGVALIAAADDASRPAAAAAASVRGRVRLAVEGVRIADVGPIVAYLDALEGRLAYAVPADVPEIHQKNARFVPPFLAVAAGQTVALVNDDAITHNVFSYSKPNDFDLGLYPRGESRMRTFREPGVVRLYCSIHKTMNAVVFVAPSPYFAAADASGAFELGGVPPGRYRLKVWNAMLPAAEQPIEVGADGLALEVVVKGGG